ncbi:MAG: hypothetical protein A2289_05875 [Deltaproteobacteria bacterium RIFOXYA12_FULL_58_15]|nr:MAG: hypothetical protein A2289_05875 [Deltaproteobacteria bacterium RIFOXYA12_FULL_58_15]OGR13719.1 MAG: hypothetical protein A2341_05810 [Deltaproteobacteria bacterium RIFOXYB12_FULL_58_9]
MGSRSPSIVIAMAIVAATATATCSSDPREKLETLPIQADARAALARLRFVPLHNGDRLEQGDLIVCGSRDRVTLGFSKKLVVDFLGRDSSWLIEELFWASEGEVVLFAVPPQQVMRIDLPRGIGSNSRHPDGWVREVTGHPVSSSDARTIAGLFGDDQTHELFALRDERKTEPMISPATAKATAAASQAVSPDSHPTTKRQPLGVSVFPRMGPRSGVVISEVVSQSPAAKSGLDKGDRIVKVDGTPVGDFRELRDALHNSRSAEINLEVVEKTARTKRTVSVDLSL